MIFYPRLSAVHPYCYNILQLLRTLRKVWSDMPGMSDVSDVSDLPDVYLCVLCGGICSRSFAVKSYREQGIGFSPGWAVLNSSSISLSCCLTAILLACVSLVMNRTPSR